MTAQVAGFITGMNSARAATESLAKTSNSAAASLQKHNEVMSTLGKGFLVGGATAAAGLALVIKASTDFGAKMAQLQSLSHASAGEMKQLSDAAMSAGQAYGFSATQVADAEIELQKAGIGVKEQLGGALTGALTLAAAGQMDVAQATEITTVAMTQFGLSAKDVPHLADLLAAGADKALGSVGDLGEALKNGGLQAHNMGMSIDDTVGLLSAFANSGIIGAEAGTQMRSMFIALQHPSAAAKKTLDEYNIALSDSKGNFVGVTKLGDELRDHLGGLSQANRNTALATIFGSHAITGATVLYQDSGKAAEKAGLSIADWNKAVREGGFANAQAAGKMNSLQGDVSKLSASVQTDMIKLGTAANAPLRGLVQDVTGVAHAFGDLSPYGQTAIVTATAVTSAIGIGGGAFLIAVPKVLAFKSALDASSLSGRGLAKIFGVGGAVVAGIAVVGAGFAAMGTRGVASTQQIEQAGLALTHNWKGVDAAFKSAGSTLTSGKGLKASLDELGDGGLFASGSAAKFVDAATGLVTFGLAGTHLADVYKSNEGTFDAFGQQLGGLAKQNYGAASQSFGGLVKQFHLGADETKNLLSYMPSYREELVALAGKAHVAATDQNLIAIAQGKGAVSAKVLAAAQAEATAAAAKQQSSLDKLAGNANSANTSIQTLGSTISNFGKDQLTTSGAQIAFQQAVRDAKKTAGAGDASTDNHTRLDLTTQKGDDAQTALNNIASTGISAAAAMTQTNSWKAVTKAVADARSNFISTARAMGLTKTAAEKQADALNLIPSKVKTTYKLSGDDVDAKEAAARAKNFARDFAKGNYKAVLKGDFSPAQRAAAGAQQKADSFAHKSYQAVLRANPNPAGTSAAEARAKAQTYANGVYMASLRGDSGPALAAVAQARAALEGLNGKMATVYVQAVTQSSVPSSVSAALIASGRAEGGPIDGPGPKGKDSVVTLMAPGEHVWTDKEVDAVGGHQAMYRMRAAAKSGMLPRFASGGSLTTAERKAKSAAEAADKKLSGMQVDFLADVRAGAYKSASKFVSELEKLAKDSSNYSAAARKRYGNEAGAASKALKKLESSSSAAADKLKDLKDKSAELKSSTASSITGGYALSNAAGTSKASSWAYQDGVRYQTYSGAASASSINTYEKKAAGDTKAFAAQLKKLAGRGVNANLLAEIAGYGTEAGAPFAAALLSAPKSELKTINANYAAVSTYANQAGSTVANATYEKQIKAADKNASTIKAQIEKTGKSLEKIIGRALHLKGYAAGTMNAADGMHWVGENGPELMYTPGGSHVIPKHWMSGSATAHAGLPKEITLLDADGSILTRARVQTKSLIATSNHDSKYHAGLGQR